MGAVTAALARAIGLAGDAATHAERWSLFFRALLVVLALAIAIPLGKLIWDSRAFQQLARDVVTLARLLPGALVALWQAAFGTI